MSAGYDAQLNNDSDRNVKQYVDLDLFFGKKNSDRDINTVTDIQSVKRSIRNLVLLNHYEKPFHPEIASGIRDMLFENITPIVGNVLARKVEDVINNYEPRARLISVRSLPDVDRNGYEIVVTFYVVNAPTELIELSLLLERLR
mgnify:FL=1|tara:strand:- start:1002 stop:1433 length:432 start_codon:yes stop_codon:yes gene_type:complete